MKSCVLVLLAACAGGGSDTPRLDAPAGDANRVDSAVTPDTVEPYRHTIAIDGGDDFVGVETFGTTSAGYSARITWDAQNVYVGYSGPDLDPVALDTASKWLFTYVDIDPGAGAGATTSEAYNTQHATFPTGFGAEFYARWKCDATFSSIETYSGTVWSANGAAPPAAQSGSFVELAIPRSVIGPASVIGIVTWMINEKANFEGSFAGLYTGNFVDGYAAALPITTYLKIDFDSVRAPNDAANRAP